MRRCRLLSAEEVVLRATNRGGELLGQATPCPEKTEGGLAGAETPVPDGTGAFGVSTPGIPGAGHSAPERVRGGKGN
jgi:hypothetical protein